MNGIDSSAGENCLGNSESPKEVHVHVWPQDSCKCHPWGPFCAPTECSSAQLGEVAPSVLDLDAVSALHQQLTAGSPLLLSPTLPFR